MFQKPVLEWIYYNDGREQEALICSMGPEGQAYMRQKRQQAERAAAMAAQRVSWEEELKEARKQRVSFQAFEIQSPQGLQCSALERAMAIQTMLLASKISHLSTSLLMACWICLR